MQLSVRAGDTVHLMVANLHEHDTLAMVLICGHVVEATPKSLRIRFDLRDGHPPHNRWVPRRALINCRRNGNCVSASIAAWWREAVNGYASSLLATVPS